TVTAAEAEQVEQLKEMVVEALHRKMRLAPHRLAALAAYVPLHSLPHAQALLERAWPAPLAAVVTPPVREPWEELQFRDSIPRLTAVEGDVSVKVRHQYEEHPYPRWVYAAKAPAPITLDEQLRIQFPTAEFQPLGKSSDIEILVAGCGTGRHPIEVAGK